MRILDLFGDQNVSTYFKEKGYEVVILVPGEKEEILNLDLKGLKERIGRFDVVWANPPCKTFSIAGIWHHYNPDGSPRTQEAVDGVLVLEKCIQVIKEIDPTYWFIENPVGKMGLNPLMKDLPKYRVTYCQYGDTKMKPTDIWTNHPNPEFRPPCKKGSTCHLPSKKGMQSPIVRNSLHQKKQLPLELVKDIYRVCNPNKVIRINLDK